MIYNKEEWPDQAYCNGESPELAIHLDRMVDEYYEEFAFAFREPESMYDPRETEIALRDFTEIPTLVLCEIRVNGDKVLFLVRS